MSTIAVPAQRATREQHVLVSVLDKDGNPVPDLAAGDFIVRENDMAREVLRVEPASAPMQIMMLVDTSANTQIDSAGPAPRTAGVRSRRLIEQSGVSYRFDGVR